MKKPENSIACRICNSHECSLDRTVPSWHFPDKVICFIQCNNCGTIQADAEALVEYDIPPGTGPGTGNGADNPYLREYLETIAGYHSFIRLLLLAKEQKNHQRTRIRVLDIGGGFGLLAHVAKLVFKWDVVAADPASWNLLGRTSLGIETYRGYVERHTFSDSPFDIIICSETIEHVPNPDALIASIAGNLKSDGIVILTTPNAEVISMRNCIEDEWKGAYEAVGHFNLFTGKSLELVLKRNGFAHTHIYSQDGTSGKKQLVALASAYPLGTVSSVRPELIDKLFINYSKLVRKEPVRDALHKIHIDSMNLRLFEIYANMGKYRTALAAGREFEKRMAAMELTPQNLIQKVVAEHMHEYVVNYPCFLGKYCYYRGIIALNSENDYRGAKMYFAAASHVLMLIRKFALGNTEELIGLSLFHEAKSALLCGEHDESLRLLNTALRLDFVPQEVKNRIEGQLRESAISNRTKHKEENMENTNWRTMNFDIYQFFESLVNAASYNDAEAVAKVIDIYLSHNKIEINDLRNFTNSSLNKFENDDQVNKFGKHLYFRGMLLLNHRSDYGAATENFLAAGNILQKLKESGFNVEIDFIGLAFLHQALALKYSGNEAQAASVVARALDLHYLRDNERNRLMTLKEQLYIM